MITLIPMAGSGQRFLDAGYKRSKPFIDIKGKPMITRVIENLGGIRDGNRLVLVARNKDVEYLHPEAIVIEIAEKTEGAACTCLLARDIINVDESLIIANSDQIVNDYQFLESGIKYFMKNDCDAGIWCFLNKTPNHSYCSINSQVFVNSIKEKQVISPLALTGIFWYKSGSFCVDAIDTMISEDLRVNDEFYLAPSLTYMHGRIGVWMVNEFLSMGTPQELEESLPCILN